MSILRIAKMKVLLIVASLVVLLVLMVVAIGTALPQNHTASRSAFIRATPDQVFRLVSGPQDWRADLKQFKVGEENGHPVIRETDKHGQTITYEVVQSQPPNQLKRTIADKSLPFGGSWTWNIQPQPGGSAVTIIEEGEIYNPVFRFLSRFVIGHTRTIDNYLAMLRAAAEGGK